MTTPSDAPDWRGMSQQELDLGLNNGVAVAGQRRHRRRLGAAFRADARPLRPTISTCATARARATGSIF